MFPPFSLPHIFCNRQPLFLVDFLTSKGYTKLRIWGLTQYKRVVYIDADALVMDSVDEVKENRSRGDRGPGIGDRSLTCFDRISFFALGLLSFRFPYVCWNFVCVLIFILRMIRSVK